MNFKTKAVVAALALAAFAGQASAAVVDTGAGNVGGSDLLFYVIDAAKSNSFVLDLGNAGSFTQASTINQAFSGSAFGAGSAWASFTAADASWSSNSVWGVVNGSAAGTGIGFIGSTLNVSATAAGQNNNNINGAVSQLQALFLNTGIATGGQFYSNSAAADNAFITINGSANPANVLYNTSGFFDASNAVGATNVAFDTLTTKAGRGAVPTVTAFAPTNGNGFAFATGANGLALTYNVASVPEPETYSMLAAGLLMLGAVARRRRA
jgi:hypothetical protein